jgi:hypothetical protein
MEYGLCFKIGNIGIGVDFLSYSYVLFNISAKAFIDKLDKRIPC